MTSTARIAPPPPELEPFLFAELVREDNGMVLTVASAFARLGLDPWDQAATLSRLSDSAAAVALAALLGRLPGASGFSVPPLVARLVPLLPRASDPPPAAPAGSRGESQGKRAVTAAASRPSVWVWLFWGAVAVSGLYALWF